MTDKQISERAMQLSQWFLDQRIDPIESVQIMSIVIGAIAAILRTNIIKIDLSAFPPLNLQ